MFSHHLRVRLAFLLALGSQRSQLSETGDPGFGSRTFFEPIPQPVKVDGRGSGQVL